MIYCVLSFFFFRGRGGVSEAKIKIITLRAVVFFCHPHPRSPPRLTAPPPSLTMPKVPAPIKTKAGGVAKPARSGSGTPRKHHPPFAKMVVDTLASFEVRFFPACTGALYA